MSQQMPPQGPYGQPVPSQGAPLPQRAQARLSAMRGDARHRGLSTSDLSVNEFVLTREAGFEPIGLVMGTSIYHVGWQSVKWNQSQEVTVLTQAMFNARELAMTRMVGGRGKYSWSRWYRRRTPGDYQPGMGNRAFRVCGYRHRRPRTQWQILSQCTRASLYLRPLWPGFLDAPQGWLSPRWSGYGKLRLSHRAP